MYKSKYIKYKQKYLQIKGGMNAAEPFNRKMFVNQARRISI